MWRAVLAAAAAAAALASARELDPAACTARFDVQRDKIIRTEESREMGARYLSELDVGARDECLRLCCETDACDVFVYEEKSPGSCYLFNCGPPEDFRCKFTAHSNFSSGVLALSRRLAELQDQERLAPPPPPVPTPPPLPKTTTVPSSSLATSPLPVVVPAHAQPSPQTPPQRGTPTRCSRYQWECHSGDECIAVYNACDGVPQCADGSDEAPELGCPAAAAAAAAAAGPVRAPAPPSTRAPPPPALPSPPNYPAQMFEQEGGGAAPALPERWPHRLLQAQPRRYPGSESGAGPHIFSHKGGLVQEEAFEPPAPAPQSWPHRPWPHQSESGTWGGWGREWAEAPRAGWGAPQLPQPAPPDAELPPYLAPGTMPEMPVLYPQRQPPHDGPKKGLGLEPAAAPTPQPHPAEPPKSVPEEQKAGGSVATAAGAAAGVHGPVTDGGAPAPAAAEAAARREPPDEHDGLSERPPAAVLLLVLGVAMTGALGVALGCRARAAGRRLRRGGKTLAHDADYLVNGMYL